MNAAGTAKAKRARAAFRRRAVIRRRRKECRRAIAGLAGKADHAAIRLQECWKARAVSLDGAVAKGRDRIGSGSEAARGGEGFETMTAAEGAGRGAGEGEGVEFRRAGVVRGVVRRAVLVSRPELYGDDGGGGKAIARIIEAAQFRDFGGFEHIEVHAERAGIGARASGRAGERDRRHAGPGIRAKAHVHAARSPRAVIEGTAAAPGITHRRGGNVIFQAAAGAEHAGALREVHRPKTVALIRGQRGIGGCESADDHARRIQQREVAPRVFETEIRVQVGGGIRPVFGGSEHHAVSAGGESRTRRKGPLRGQRGIVRQPPAAEIHRHGGRIVQLDPVAPRAVFIAQRVRVLRHDFRDADGGRERGCDGEGRGIADRAAERIGHGDTVAESVAGRGAGESEHAARRAGKAGAVAQIREDTRHFTLPLVSEWLSPQSLHRKRNGIAFPHRLLERLRLHRGRSRRAGVGTDETDFPHLHMSLIPVCKGVLAVEQHVAGGRQIDGHDLRGVGRIRHGHGTEHHRHRATGRKGQVVGGFLIDIHVLRGGPIAVRGGPVPEDDRRDVVGRPEVQDDLWPRAGIVPPADKTRGPIARRPGLRARRPRRRHGSAGDDLRTLRRGKFRGIGQIGRRHLPGPGEGGGGLDGDWLDDDGGLRADGECGARQKGESQWEAEEGGVSHSFSGSKWFSTSRSGGGRRRGSRGGRRQRGREGPGRTRRGRRLPARRSPATRPSHSWRGRAAA